MKYNFLKPFRRFRNSIIAVTESQSKFYSAIVLVCGFILAIGLCLTFRPKFEFHYSGDIVSWLIVNKYPKQQETYYYLLSLILVPSISVAIWLIWQLWSKAVSFFTKLPSHHVLKKYALTYLTFILILGNISTPTFKKMLLIPLILFLSANIVFLVYDLLKNRLRKLTKSVFEGASDQHWCVIASGICVGLFILINYGENPRSLLSCLKIIALSALAVWLFWIVCSVLLKLFWFYKAKFKSKKHESLNPPLSPFQKGDTTLSIENTSSLIPPLVNTIPVNPPLVKGGRGDFRHLSPNFSFNEAKAMLVYPHVPLVLLLLVSLLYEHGNVLIIISLACMLILKVLIFIKPAWMMKLVSMRVHKHLLDYVLVPAIIYAIFYSGGNIHGGIDLFHEGERIAPLNEGLRGAVPYKDVYLQHGLFYNFYRPLLSAKLFGPTLASDRLLGSILDPLGHVGFYLFALQIFRRKLSAFILLWILSSGVTEEFVFWNVSRRMVYTPGRLATAYFALAILAFYLNRRNKTDKFLNPPLSPFQKGETEFPLEKIKPSIPPLLKGGRGDFKTKIFRSISWLPLMAGIISCITIFNSLEIGFYTTATCFLFLLLFGFSPQARSNDFYFWKRLISGFRPLLNYIIGICIVFITISIYLAIYGAFDDMIANSYVQTRYQSIIWGLRFPPLFSELAKVKSIETIKAFIISDTFKWYMPIVVYLISATYLAYQMLCSRLWKVKSNVKLLLLIIAGIVFFRTMLGRSDGTHLYGMSFAWILGMYLIESLFIRTWAELKMDFRTAVSWHSHSPMSTLSHPISVIAWRVIVILTLVWYATSVYNPIDAAKQLSAIVSGYGKVERYVDSPLERAGKMLIPADQVSQIKAVVKYIQSNTHPDETIFDFSNQGGYYFFADRPSATRYIQICYASTDAMQMEVIESLKQHKTNLVIFSNSSWMDSIDGVSSLDRHRLIAKYLKDNYVESTKIGTTTIYKGKR